MGERAVWWFSGLAVCRYYSCCLMQARKLQILPLDLTFFDDVCACGDCVLNPFVLSPSLASFVCIHLTRLDT